MKPTLAIILVTVALVALLPLETLAVLTSLASVVVVGAALWAIARGQDNGNA